MDRVYKADIPASRKALEDLERGFSRSEAATDWNALRVRPLLEHARNLERLLLSPRFARETSRLRTGVVMFHSDLVYLRENIKALRGILKSARESRPSAGSRARTRAGKRKSQRGNRGWPAFPSA